MICNTLQIFLLFYRKLNLTQHKLLFNIAWKWKEYTPISWEVAQEKYCKVTFKLLIKLQMKIFYQQQKKSKKSKYSILALSLMSAFILREINEPFFLENASKLTREFLQDIFNKKIHQNVIQTSGGNFDAFSRKNGSIIFPPNGGAQKRKC